MTRRKTATSGAGRCGSRVVHEELSASGGECGGGLWHREKQREPTIRGREQQSVAGAVRAAFGGFESGRPHDRRYSLWRPSAGCGFGKERPRTPRWSPGFWKI